MKGCGLAVTVKKRCPVLLPLPPSVLARSASLTPFPITSSSLTSPLTKVFIGLRSINYHPISKSHSGTAAMPPRRVKSLHFRES